MRGRDGPRTPPPDGAHHESPSGPRDDRRGDSVVLEIPVGTLDRTGEDPADAVRREFVGKHHADVVMLGVDEVFRVLDEGAFADGKTQLALALWARRTG